MKRKKKGKVDPTKSQKKKKIRARSIDTLKIAKKIEMENSQVKKSNEEEGKGDINKYVYLPVETKVRELEAKLLLSYYAVQHGYKVVIGNSETIEKAIGLFPPGIFLDKGYMVKDKYRRFKKAKEIGHKVINLEEEGFPLTEENLYLEKYLSKENLSILDYEFCWGEYQKKVITDSYPFCEKKCLLTGNPRFDLLNEKFRYLFKEEISQIKNNYGPFILVNTRFPMYTQAVDVNGGIDSRIVKRFIKAYGRSIYINMLNNFVAFNKMIKELSIKYPYKKFIIRPHPSDNFDAYKFELKDIDNVDILHKGNVVSWILGSELVIHNSCTTGVESFLLKKPVISYVPYVEDRFNLPNDLGIRVTNINQLYEFIDNHLVYYDFNDNKFDEDKKTMLLSKHYCFSNNEFAYQKIIKGMNSLVEKNNENSLSVNHEKINNHFSRWTSKIKTKENKMANQKFPILTEREITSFLHNLNAIEERDTEIIIQKLYNNLFELKKR